MKSALIVVDMQNDFMPGGPLAVPEGDRIIPAINALMEHFEPVVATRDWHGPDHRSFASQHPGSNPGDAIEVDGLEQVLQPEHCVADTGGAAFAPGLNTVRFRKVFRKGTDPNVSSHSGFFDTARRHATGLHEFLTGRLVTRVYIVGVPTESGVKFTALDAAELGFETFVVADACRGVNAAPDDSKNALLEMKQAGVSLITSDQLCAERQ